ncbi:MAG TPA: CPBP family intramembrane glutamic endopeptidase [Longimicrobiales bacterium]|nr:CPBP family intramembrane glutamic endopeptidase [Longimicrobiales bacterium]
MSSRAFVRLALIAVPVGAWAFAARADAGIAAAILASILLVSLPALAVAQIGIVPPDELDTVSVYLSSALLIALLGTVSLVLGVIELGAASMGLGPASPETLLVWSVVATVGGVAVLVVANLISRFMNWRETDLVRLLMPSNGVERVGFVVVSITAGIGEELAYRAFLLGLLSTAFGAPWTAAAVTSIAFGLLHAYQGPLGMLRTGSIGFLFAAVVVISGSVWPVVVGHIMINLTAGLALGEWLLERDD